MRKTYNGNATGDKIEGRVYSYNLSLKKVGNKESKNYGQDFITGTLSIATDDACTNVVDIHYSYVAPKTNAGADNNTFIMLKQIMDKNKTVESVGKDQAMQVSARPAIAVNDFYTERNGEVTLVSAKRLEGGFLSTPYNNKLVSEASRNKLTVNMYITGLEEKEGYCNVNGYIFSYKGEILPVTFVAKNEAIITFIENKDVSKQNPLFTTLRIRVNVSEVTVTKKAETNFIGESEVREYTNTRREYLITDLSPEGYSTDDEVEGISANEITQKIKDREAHLVDVKKRFEDSKNNKSNSTPVVASMSSEKFDF